MPEAHGEQPRRAPAPRPPATSASRSPPVNHDAPALPSRPRRLPVRDGLDAPLPSDGQPLAEPRRPPCRAERLAPARPGRPLAACPPRPRPARRCTRGGGRAVQTRKTKPGARGSARRTARATAQPPGPVQQRRADDRLGTGARAAVAAQQRPAGARAGAASDATPAAPASRGSCDCLSCFPTLGSFRREQPQVTLLALPAASPCRCHRARGPSATACETSKSIGFQYTN